LILSATSALGDAKIKLIDDPILTDAGLVSGTTIGTADVAARVYRGIPYAAPPVGDLRWKAPEPVTPWKDIRECTQMGTYAVQFGGPFTALSQSEDCLYLNVVTPAKNAQDKLPVMVWLHGGGVAFGHGDDIAMNSYRLPSHGAVVVLVNMRLGALGLLAHPWLTAEQGHSGNYMYEDMLAALKWVQKNIAAFGGDPNNVTIFGQSGGGSKVCSLIASPLSAGLVDRGICQSGASTMGVTPTLAAYQAQWEDFFGPDYLDVTSLEEARAVPWETLVATAGKYLADKKIQYSECVDGYFLPDTVTNIYASGKQNRCNILVGANLGELTGSGEVKMPQVIPAYVKMLEGTVTAGMKGYAYIFDQVMAGWKALGVTSCHGTEVGYVFGDYDGTLEWHTGGNYPLAQSTVPGIILPRDPGGDLVDKKVSEATMSMWVAFAKTGNPSVNKVVQWPAWSPGTAYDPTIKRQFRGDQYLYIAEPLEIKSGFSKVGQ